MKHLNAKAIGGLLAVLLVMSAGLFLSAGTLDYWEAWLLLAVFFVASLAITLYLMKEDPALLERRVYGGPAAEKETSQKIIQSLAAAAFIATLVVPGLDHRFGWSRVPMYAQIAGDVLLALGFIIIFFVYKENSFTSATINVYAGQSVVSTGPYALVRHPMYGGAFLMFLGMPLALGSWWGLPVVAVVMPALIWRLLDESFLLKSFRATPNTRPRCGGAWCPSCGRECQTRWAPPRSSAARRAFQASRPCPRPGRQPAPVQAT